MTEATSASQVDHILADDRFSILGSLRDVLRRRETIRMLVSVNLRAGHRDKLLGNLWNLLDPLLFLGVYFLVFGIGLRQAAHDPLEFVAYLSIGVLVFRFFDGVVMQAASCLRAHRGIILEVRFPKAVLPISLCLSRLYDLLWGLAVLIGLMLLIGMPFSPALVWLPVAITLQFFLCLGLGFMVAYLGVFFADTANIIAVLTRLLFFASPIFYFARSESGHTGIVPERYMQYYMLNPVAGLLDIYRNAILWSRTPDLENIGYLAAIAGIALVVGFVVFARGEGRFAKFL